MLPIQPVTGEVEDNEVPRGGFEIPESDEYEQDASALDLHVDAHDLDSFEAGNKKMRAGGSPPSSAQDIDLLQQSRDQDGSDGMPPGVFAARTTSHFQSGPVQPPRAMDDEDAFEADIDAALARRAVANQSANAGTTDQDMWDAIVANEGGPQDMEAQPNGSMVHAGIDEDGNDKTKPEVGNSGGNADGREDCTKDAALEEENIVADDMTQ
eukprot:32725-Chlamydomonas_euryale.AAC.17